MSASTAKTAHLFLSFTLTAAAVGAQDFDPAAAAAALRPWFAMPPAERAAPSIDVTDLLRADAEALVPLLFAVCRDGARERGEDTLPPLLPEDQKRALQPAELTVGDYTFPYVLLVKGDKPAAGWPLFICLHGGGGNGKAEGPHAWSVNDREWEAQKRLFQRVYEPAGVYFIPRMADDRRGRWWHDHNQVAFAEVIEKAILFRDVDPNRVYLIGISEGGYGAIRFAANRPDRFAATGGMAAAEPMGTSPPENMRNVGMRIDIGENDTMFDRIGLARRMGERLAELRALDPAGYDCMVNVQPGRGHGIDYSFTPKWVAERARDPRPKRVVWTVKKFDSRVARHWYWLALKTAPEQMPLHLDVRIEGNHIAITAELPAKGDAPAGRMPAPAGHLRIRLDDRLVDLDRPVTFALDGRPPESVRLQRSLAVMAQTLAESGDPEYCFCAELVVDLAAGSSR